MREAAIVGLWLLTAALVVLWLVMIVVDPSSFIGATASLIGPAALLMTMISRLKNPHGTLPGDRDPSTPGEPTTAGRSPGAPSVAAPSTVGAAIRPEPRRVRGRMRMRNFGDLLRVILSLGPPAELVLDAEGRLHFYRRSRLDKDPTQRPDLTVEPGQLRAAVPLFRSFTGPSLLVGYTTPDGRSTGWEEFIMAETSGGTMPKATGDPEAWSRALDPGGVSDDIQREAERAGTRLIRRDNLVMIGGAFILTGGVMLAIAIPTTVPSGDYWLLGTVMLMLGGVFVFALGLQSVMSRL